MAGVILLLNLVGWACCSWWLRHNFHSDPPVCSVSVSGVTAFMLACATHSMRDHIAAIDNTTRKLMEDGSARCLSASGSRLAILSVVFGPAPAQRGRGRWLARLRMRLDAQTTFGLGNAR